MDPASGIFGGQRWELVLYSRLRAARAVVVVHTAAWQESKWCFAEATHAMAVGRPVIPLLFDETALAQPFNALQGIDARGSKNLELALRNALREAGLEPSFGGAPWPADRSPYRGLEAYGAQDEAALFGRFEQVQSVVERLALARQLGQGALVLLVGPSGAGKSSILLAGVLPRLRAAGSGWQVHDPIRLSSAFHLGTPEGKVDQINNVSEVWPIDQLEELLSVSAAERQLDWLSSVAAWIASRPGQRIALATLRSDFLPALEPLLQANGIRLELIAIAPLERNGIREAIVGPAELAGISLADDGLVDLMVNDCADGRAMPLLSFTLRAMFERTTHPRQFSIDLYQRELGGIRGSVQRVVEFALSHLANANSDAALEKLMLRLVRQSDDGRYVRRRADLDLMPPELQGLVPPLVGARLLVAESIDGRRTVEVAHEALFSQWGKLSDWLEQRQDFLAWRRRFDFARSEWVQQKTFLRPEGVRQADKWMSDGYADLDAAEEALLTASREEHRGDDRARTILKGLRMIAFFGAAAYGGAELLGSLLSSSFFAERVADDNSRLRLTAAFCLAWGLFGAVASPFAVPRSGMSFAAKTWLAWASVMGGTLVAAAGSTSISLLAFTIFFAALWSWVDVLGSSLTSGSGLLRLRWTSAGLFALLFIWIQISADSFRSEEQLPSPSVVAAVLSRLQGTFPFDERISTTIALFMTSLIVVPVISCALVSSWSSRTPRVLPNKNLRAPIVAVIASSTILAALSHVDFAIDRAYASSLAVDKRRAQVESLSRWQAAFKSWEGRYAPSVPAILTASERWSALVGQQCSEMSRQDIPKLRAWEHARTSGVGKDLHDLADVEVVYADELGFIAGARQSKEASDWLCIAKHGSPRTDINVPIWASAPTKGVSCAPASFLVAASPRRDYSPPPPPRDTAGDIANERDELLALCDALKGS